MRTHLGTDADPLRSAAFMDSAPGGRRASADPQPEPPTRRREIGRCQPRSRSPDARGGRLMGVARLEEVARRSRAKAVAADRTPCP
jgi:hypothetical protein